MAIIPARIQLKRGPLSQLDKSMLLPGEFAVPTDSDSIYICIRAGVVLEIPSRENLSGLLDKISEQSISVQAILDSFEQLEITKCNIDDSGVSVLTTYSSSKIEDMLDNYYTKAESDLRYGPSTLLSDAYSNQNTYSEGEYCIYNNVLYKCKAAISSAEEFNAEHWEKTSVSNEIAAANNNISNKQDAKTAITTSNIDLQSVKYATSAKTANSATNATAANSLKSSGTGTAMTFNYNQSTSPPTGLWGTHLGAQNHYVYTPANVVKTGKGVQSNNTADFYQVTEFYTFTSSNNALIAGSKGNYIFGISAFSDEKLKKDILDSDVDALDLVRQIKMRKFDFVDDKFGQHKDIGYVAQELKEIVPEAVVLVPQDKKACGYDELYQVVDTALIPYLVKAVQELSEEVSVLRGELSNDKS